MCLLWTPVIGIWNSWNKRECASGLSSSHRVLLNHWKIPIDNRSSNCTSEEPRRRRFISFLKSAEVSFSALFNATKLREQLLMHQEAVDAQMSSQRQTSSEWGIDFGRLRLRKGMKKEKGKKRTKPNQSAT